MADGMDMLGYKAVNVGEGDLVFGDAFLATLADRVSFPFLSASVLASNAPPFPSHEIVDVAGLSIGIAGLLDDGFSEYAAAHSDPGRPLTLRETGDALQQGLTALGEDPHLKVLLAHCPYEELRVLLESNPGFDLVISGHDTNTVVQTQGELINGAWVVQAGWDGKTIGRLDLTFDRTGALTNVMGSFETLDNRWPDHPAMTTLHDEYLASVEAAIDDILAQYPVQDPPTGGSYEGRSNCRTCHQPEHDAWTQTKHAIAWETLAHQQRDYDPECFACHTTGFTYTGGFRLFPDTPAMGDVQCEMCHGAGADHAANPTLPYGHVDEATCTQCHVPLHSPSFDYPTYLPKIQHK